MQLATFGAGCFWGVEARFREIAGVQDAAAGYMGGHVDNPTYEQVCSDETGHAEVVQVAFDPDQVSYRKLLEAFFDMHDPTQLNRQGADTGTQYRSTVFFHDRGQQDEARALLDEIQASGRFQRPVVTSLEPATTFWRAEEYHQQYLARSGRVCSL